MFFTSTLVTASVQKKCLVANPTINRPGNMLRDTSIEPCSHNATEESSTGNGMQSATLTSPKNSTSSTGLPVVVKS